MADWTMPQAVYNTVRPTSPQTVSFSQIGKSSILFPQKAAAASVIPRIDKTTRNCSHKLQVREARLKNQQGVEVLNTPSGV